MSKHLRIVIGASAMVLCAAKCSRAQEEFLAVQVCIPDEGGATQFADIMREVARSEGLRFVDGSAETRDYLQDVRDKGQVKLEHIPTINMGIEGKEGLGVTAGNLGLLSNQVALGFTAGRNVAKARKLADHLVKALSQKWRVQTVPKGQGSFPMRNC
ncbi:hypothetical protein [Sphingomonas pruni]|uniref:hypothetical protein n=1 Tax=Sphingomonas pruni TaxID=40683 RepID=UPI0012EDF3F5|nr:hypothetical protein [Sphingomonas pruni]